MRQIGLVLLSALALMPAAHAQSIAPSRVGFYFGMDNNVGAIRSETGYLAGAEIAAVLSQQFTVGLAGYALATEDARVPSGAGAPDTLRFGYGGIRVGYLFRPDARFHPIVDLLLGGGEARAEGGAPEREDEVFVAEPSILMEANINRYMRGALGLSYRYVSGSGLAGVSNASLGGVAARLTLRFGRF